MPSDHILHMLYVCQSESIVVAAHLRHLLELTGVVWDISFDVRLLLSKDERTDL